MYDKSKVVGDVVGKVQRIHFVFPKERAMKTIMYHCIKTYFHKEKNDIYAFTWETRMTI